MRLTDIDGITVYDDATPDRVAVVWPWEMERLADGVMHIPIFLNVLQGGLYYTKILVRPLTSPIPYAGPSEDLDITAPDVIAATGTLLTRWGVLAPAGYACRVQGGAIEAARC